MRAQLTRLQQPAAVAKILGAVLPSDFQPAEAVCTMQKAHADRFTLRAQLRSESGEEHVFAVKVYSDDFGRQVWEHSQALAKHSLSSLHRLCLATRYLAEERALIFPWVNGPFLSEIVDDRKPELLRQAARLAADLHRLPIVAERRTTLRMILKETLGRCDRLRAQWPEAAPMVKPLLATLEEAANFLDPTPPALVHGDMAAGQFLWTVERLVLLDLDMFGYTDPAYDVGHFLGQLERRCLCDAPARAHAPEWLACFRDTYLAAMPQVSPRNVSFYHGLTLLRKIYTVVRTQPKEWPQLAPPLAARAQAALHEVVASRQN
ncbi:MAG TPA: aminoglycoside phosphotransferase family protein [Verrucomicrobiae bacterium]